MMDKKMSLEDVRDWHRVLQHEAENDGLPKAALMHEQFAAAIDAELKARGEPIAWGYYSDDGKLFSLSSTRSVQNSMPLYTAPPAPKENAE